MPETDEVLKGARAMCDAVPELGLTPGAVSYHLNKGHFNDIVWRLGRLHVTTRRRLREKFGLT